MKKLWLVFIILLSSCTARNEEIVSPTLTPVAVSPTPTAENKLSIPQPDWAKDEDANILLFPWGGIIQPESQDAIYLTIDHPYWIDKNHIGFYSINDMDLPLIDRKKYVLDLVDWQVVEVTEIKQPTFEVVEKTPLLNIDQQQTATPIKIFNEQSQKWEVFLYPPYELYNLQLLYALEKIFVIQGQERYGEGTILRVYDFNTKKMLKTLNGRIEMNILRYFDEKVLYVTENTLCFIQVLTLEEKCGAYILTDYENVVLGWNIDSLEFIPFLYQEPVEKYFSSKKICFLSTYHNNIKCPLKDLDIFKPKITVDPNQLTKTVETIHVWGYSVSPDHKKLIFCYGNSAYVRYENTAIVDMDGSNFQILDDIEPLLKPTFTIYCQRPGNNLLGVQWRPSE